MSYHVYFYIEGNPYKETKHISWVPALGNILLDNTRVYVEEVVPSITMEPLECCYHVYATKGWR